MLPLSFIKFGLGVVALRLLAGRTGELAFVYCPGSWPSCIAHAFLEIGRGMMELHPLAGRTGGLVFFMARGAGSLYVKSTVRYRKSDGVWIA